MRITPDNFFDHYIIDPLSKDLSFEEKIFALACSILTAIPFGIFHFRALYLQHKKISAVIDLHAERATRFQQIAASIAKVSFRVLKAQEGTVPITIKEVPKIIHERFIQKYYAKPLAPEEEVTVPYVDPQTGEKSWRKWSSLTREEKIHVNNTGTHEHNKIASWEPESAVDSWFFVHGQRPFLEGDPRQFHGNDHAARAAFIAPIFAYLYQQYHPRHDVSTQDIVLSQIVAAGHDSGRQTDGPDVYDDTSAENTIRELQELGITDPHVFHDVEEAIANKDSDPLNPKKCLLAKCAQNADCAEFSRILLESSSRQDEEGFAKSKEYLDIFKELSALSEKNPSFVLKNGLTYGNFCFELDTIRHEMNDLIFRTYKRDFRADVASSEENCYEAILAVVNPTEFPALYSILVKIGIKEPLSSQEVIKQKEDVQNTTLWLNWGIEKIPTESVKKLLKALEANPLQEASSLKQTLTKEIEYRANKESSYLSTTSPDEIITSYAALPPLLRRSYTTNLAERIDQNRLQSFVTEADELIRNSALCALCEIESTTLQQQVSSLSPDGLKKQAEELLARYKETARSFRPTHVQTTIAYALEEAAHRYLLANKKQEAKETLQLASTLHIEASNPFSDLQKLVQEFPGDMYRYIPADCGFVRKRKVGVLQKILQKQPQYEMSLEIPPHMRERLNTTISELIPESQKSLVPAIYQKKDKKEYIPQPIVEIKEDLLIKLKDGIEIQIGANKNYWTQYHFMRIRVQPHISTQEVHEALSSIGLPTALMQTRQEDVEHEMMARSLAFHFPKQVYQDLPAQKSPNEIYASLTKEQKLVVDKDVKKAKLTLVGNNHFEVVQPEIAEEAWKLGVRGVGCFLSHHKTFEGAAETMTKIIKNGFLSSQDRFQHGIGGGCVPDCNYQTGSGNQVFARILTDNLFKDNFDVGRFALSGQIFVMLDTKVLERMPYFYTKDRNGLQNPHHYNPLFTPEGQRGEVLSSKNMQEQVGFKEHIEILKKRPFPTNEVMFDLNVGARYSTKMLVWTEVDRLILISTLQKAGIYEIGGEPVESAVVCGTALRPELVSHYYDENPYKEQAADDTRYI